ncbi:MAG TPA: argininosuccinate lyase [Candidatus Dormibacteraeota bacterium]|nr:argininosuccinate lyase [Candidatus Dormibacteraeota bacterium]
MPDRPGRNGDAPSKNGDQGGAVEARGGRLWGGRFSSGPARVAEEFTTSLAVDRRLYREDIAGSVAHARMLGATGIIPRADAAKLIKGLQAIRREIDEGAFVFTDGDEDIHTAVERRLHETIGADVAGKLHTGRSRNDQVALDLRMYAKSAIFELGGAIGAMQQSLLHVAQDHVDTLMPAYTHLQRAQPTTLAHHLLAYLAMLQRDFDRLQDAHDRADVMPLGSGAATGSSLPLNRELVAKELDFDAISQNSLDAVSDRDFVVEIEAAAALLMVHLSRLAEDLVLWSSTEFGFVELPDDYATGSSLMPQKKNPDVPELVRGRAGRVIGNLVAMLTNLKGLPLSYNRDLQEDKEGFFASVDTALAALHVLARMLPRLTFHDDVMAAAAGDPGLLATEVADYLVRKGVPFREAHAVVGKAVKRVASGKNASLAALTLQQWQALHPAFTEDVQQALDPARALSARRGTGSPGPGATKRALVRANLAVKRNRDWLAAHKPIY